MSLARRERNHLLPRRLPRLRQRTLILRRLADRLQGPQGAFQRKKESGNSYGASVKRIPAFAGQFCDGFRFTYEHNLFPGRDLTDLR